MTPIDPIVVATWARTGLAAEIDEAASNPYFGHAELSELLANAGVLPMFGFPTRVRTLYSRRVRSTSDAEKFSVADRDLGMSITAFAPGSVVVKDGAEHLCVGFVAYEFTGERAGARNPLAGALSVQRCHDCGSLETLPKEEAATCWVCGAEVHRYTVYQPEGYRTIYSQPDYDDSHVTPSYRGYTELSASTAHGDEIATDGLTISLLEQAEVVAVNDNNRKLFGMSRLDDGSIVVTDRDLYRRPLPAFMTQGNMLPAAAIGEVRRTDVLLVALDRLKLPDGCVATQRTECPAGLGAIFSFAELIRSAAKTYLDIDEVELEVGLQPAKVKDTVTSRVFLADALDNGAGYALELGQSGTLKTLLVSLRSEMGARLRASVHASACTSSCPGCLRNYQNRFHHWALDWRLGLDLVDLALGLDLDESHWWSRADELTHAFRQAFRPHGQLADDSVNDVPVLLNNEGQGSAVVLGHPLWRHDMDYRSPRVVDAVLQLRRQGIGRVNVSDLYVLDRTPFKIFSLLT